MQAKFSIAALSVAAAFSLTACDQKEEPKPAPTPAPAPVAPAPAPKPEVTVKLGHVAPMTGPQAHLGKDNENAAVLAVEELNSKKLEIGGAIVKFELVSEDDQADPKQGTLVAQKLVDAKVNGVIGHLNSGTTIPASKIYADNGMPQISASATNPAYTLQGFKTAFRVMANDVHQGKALGDFSAKQGIKTVAIIDDRTAYGQGLADEFRKAAEANGIKVLTNEYTNDKATDFKSILTKIKSKKPELVFFGGMDAQGGPLVKQMKELGLKAKFMGGDCVCTPKLMELAGEASEGQFCSLPGMPLEKLAKGPEFRDKFTKKFNAEIQLYAPYVYDAVMVMVDAMKRANSVESAKFLPEIGKTKYDGVTAAIEFDDKGDLKNGAISLYQYKGGKLEYVETLGGSPVAAAVAEAKEAVKDAAKEAAADAKAVAKEVAADVKDAAKDAAANAKGVAKEVAADVKDAAKDAAANAKGVAKEVAADVKEAAKEGVKAGAEAVKSGAEAVKNSADAAKTAAEKK